jgi:O-antigen/teichoic acid export membrane protein
MGDHELERDSTIMVLSTLLTNFFNYLYQVSMGRLLSPQDYGILYSLLSLLYIISVGGGAIQTSIARYTSKLKVHGKQGEIRYLWEFFTSKTILLGVASFLLLVLFSKPISQFLNINNEFYLISLAFFFIFGFTVSVNWGVLIGLQRFLAFGSANALWAFLKLILGILLILLGWGVYGGLLSLSIANIIVLVISFLFIRSLLKSKPKKFELGGIYSYSSLALLAAFSFTTMTYVDVILAKHYLTPELAGQFSALSVLGKIIFFVPGGIALAMFPKTSEDFERKGRHRSILLKALLYTALIAGSVTLLYLFFPSLIEWVMFGGKYLTIVPYMFEYGAAMFFFSIASLLVTYALSVHKTRIAYVAFVALLVEVLLLSIFHSGIAEISRSMLISGVVTVILMLPSLK